MMNKTAALPAVNETIFETKLINTFLADLIFKQCSFKAFSEAYNFHHSSVLFERALMNAKRLSEAFFAFEIVKYYNEHQLDEHIECKSILII